MHVPIVSKVAHTLGDLAVLGRARLVRPLRPSRMIRVGLSIIRWKTTPAHLINAAAVEHPHDVAIIDDFGAMTYGELHRRTNTLAHTLAAEGVKAGDGVAVMCRNHRGFVEALLATSKLGANALLLNTSFAAPQVAEVLGREGAVAAVADEEFKGAIAGVGIPALVSESLDDLRGREDDLRPPAEPGRIIILTSGTTGTPKGVARIPKASQMATLAGLLDRIPIRPRWSSLIAAPLFHTWGIAHLLMGLQFGHTMVLRRRFDPAQVLADLGERRCDLLVVVPVMLQRLLGLTPQTLPNLKIVAASGSALPGGLARRWMDSYGDTLYSTYGSTEVAAVSVATPQDLRDDPQTAGKPCRGTVVKLIDDKGADSPAGEPGRIFAGTAALFDGYTGGGSKEVIGGLMSTGDVGSIDTEGQLHVLGRDDEMIVSGGENVFPQEVEELLAGHPAVTDAAAVGVDDKEFGKRLRAYVVTSGPVTEEELKTYVQANLARYKVPREIRFVDELPRNATGKILKRALAADP